MLLLHDVPPSRVQKVDANTIVNFAMRARRGHHRCRDEGTSACPGGSSTKNDTLVVVCR